MITLDEVSVDDTENEWLALSQLFRKCVEAMGISELEYSLHVKRFRLLFSPAFTRILDPNCDSTSDQTALIEFFEIIKTSVVESIETRNIARPLKRKGRKL
ncbi:hypothetical protein ACOME3_006234 [Neoechinorhynchus agilis]